MESNADPTTTTAITTHPVRDTRYYFSDGGVVFLCDGVLYNLHKTRLTLKSEFFKNMFELPQGKEKEGDDDEHPIKLSENNADFRHLLVFLYDQDEVEDPPLQYYVSLLYLSQKYQISSARKYAIANLPTHRAFTAAIQLQLTRQYSILEWAELGFRSLVYRRLKNITLADALAMGVVAYHKLVQVNCQIDELNLGLAFNPPVVVHSPGCLDENECTKLWEWAWWSGFAKQLLHPENIKSRTRILESLDPSRGILASMRADCLQGTLESIWEENPFNEDEEYVTQATSELKLWMERL
ncbi:hypothetical protein B0H11DRAFT_2308212 [Mycena galericulata]|nr:hypothetical protein B0H11DRAFT_2308212 [Mycena galericulata]